MALLEGITAPEMMLLPYISEPATSSRMPSMSTGGSSDEGNDEADGGAQQRRDHQHTEPAHIEAVVGGGDPLTERFPALGTAAANRCGQSQ
jgi:hypothetical protein